MPRFIRSTSLRLPNAEKERHATWLEIFFDLIFAVIVVQISAKLYNHFDYVGVFQCVALFIPIMWTWASYTVFAARFDNNDGIHWLMTFMIMFAGVIMAIQIPSAFEKNDNGFAIGFLLAQLSILLLYSRTIYDELTPKKMTLLYMIGFGLGGFCWVISLFFEMPIKLILWALGMFIYLLIPWIGKKNILSKAPLDTIYIPERFGAFTVIILGQTIAAVVFGLEYTHWQVSSIIMSILAFILAALIWVQYYSFTQIANYKCTLGSGQPYIYTHIPLIISLIVIGVCAEEFIKTSNSIHENINLFFCLAITLYLISFFLLYYIAVKSFRICKVSYLLGIIAVFFLFYFHTLSPLILMSGIVIIFITLYTIQYWAVRRDSKDK